MNSDFLGEVRCPSEAVTCDRALYGVMRHRSSKKTILRIAFRFPDMGTTLKSARIAGGRAIRKEISST